MLRNICFLMVLFLNFSCGKKRELASFVSPKAIDLQIKTKAELYKSLHRGWANKKCDSLGFTALCKLSGGCEEANLFDAEGSAGRWYRSPERDCFDLGESKSDISKDMFVMMTPYLLISGDVAAFKRIVSYAERNAFVMGRGVPSRTVMAPDMYAFFKEITLNSKSQIFFMNDLDFDDVTFRDHLDVIWAIAKAIRNGGISRADLDNVSRLRSINPRNALFQAVYHGYTDGDQSETLVILKDDTLFPASRLPSTLDRCEEYLWQRDQDGSSRDWLPCPRDDGSFEVHDGVDFLLASWIAGQI